MPLTYKDCLELKASGFPQEGSGYIERWDEHPDEPLYKPTLSELIESCGDSLKRIEKKTKLWWALEDDECCEDPQDFTGYKIGKGSSLEQAVKNLYCSLHKK